MIYSHHLILNLLRHQARSSGLEHVQLLPKIIES